ncbi:MAG TPA: hypothetical protein VK256_05545 [Candidatus Eisenbacteria bacterium]|nr:hypothetical protein [Candidatus Eisenbacteria bacterium]
MDLLDHVFWPALLEVVRRRKARGKVTISLTTAADVLKAVSLKVMSPAETREVFGLKKRRVPVRRKVAKP